MTAAARISSFFKTRLVWIRKRQSDKPGGLRRFLPRNTSENRSIQTEFSCQNIRPACACLSALSGRYSYLLERIAALFPSCERLVGSGGRNRTDETVLEVFFSCSDNARSRSMISALSDLLALRSLANSFASIAHISNARATPIKTMLIMDPPSLGRSGVSRCARKNCAPTRVTTHRLLRSLS